MDTGDHSRLAIEPDLRLLNLQAAASYLAISRAALYVLLGSGELASVHIGRLRRVPLAELQRFVRDRLSS